MPTDELAAVRAALRQDVHDEDSNNYRWTDAVLNRHIARAVKELSYAIPFEVKSTIATTNGSRALTLNLATTFADLIRIVAVEFPVDNFPATYQRFSLWDASATTKTLTMIGDRQGDGGNAYVFWHKLHTLDTSSTTLPTWARDLVALGGAAYAAMDWASYAVNRVNAGGDDTPRHYLTWGQELLKQFKAGLRRLGHQGKLRPATLYTPNDPLPSQSTDPGP